MLVESFLWTNFVFLLLNFKCSVVFCVQCQKDQLFFSGLNLLGLNIDFNFTHACVGVQMHIPLWLTVQGKRCAAISNCLHFEPLLVKKNASSSRPNTTTFCSDRIWICKFKLAPVAFYLQFVPGVSRLITRSDRLVSEENEMLSVWGGRLLIMWKETQAHFYFSKMWAKISQIWKMSQSVKSKDSPKCINKHFDQVFVRVKLLA